MTGKVRSLHPATWLVAILFLAKFVYF
jgi:xanthine/uracil/vitamin C permease (AzgA family)